MTVREILYEWLRANGYDGLCNEDCGCRLDDLVPCCENCCGCEPGYLEKVADPTDGWLTDWVIKPGKRPAKEAPHE